MHSLTRTTLLQIHSDRTLYERRFCEYLRLKFVTDGTWITIQSLKRYWLLLLDFKLEHKYLCNRERERESSVVSYFVSWDKPNDLSYPYMHENLWVKVTSRSPIVCNCLTSFYAHIRGYHEGTRLLKVMPTPRRCYAGKILWIQGYAI